MTRSILCDVCAASHSIEDEGTFITIEIPGELLGHPDVRGVFDVCSLECLADVVAGLQEKPEPADESDISPEFSEPAVKRNGRLKPAKIPQVEDVELDPPQTLAHVTVR